MAVAPAGGHRVRFPSRRAGPFALIVVMLGAACSGAPPSGSSLADAPDGSLPPDLARMVQELPSDTAASIEWGQSIDRELASAARDAGAVDEALGEGATAILEGADTIRETLLGQAAQQETAQASTAELAGPVAIAQSLGAFVTMLSPDGLAQRVLDWKRDFDDDMPPQEAAADEGDDKASAKIVRTAAVVDGVMTVNAELIFTVSLADPPGGTYGEVFTGSLELPVCPDASGRIPATLAWKNTSDVAGSSLGTRSGEMNMSSTALGTVSDDAYLTSVDIDIEASGRAAAAAPGAQLEGAYGEIAASMTYAPGRDGGSPTFSAHSARVVHQSSRAPDEAIESLANLAAILSYSLFDDAYRQAENLWRGGTCVEVQVVDPTGGKKSDIEPESPHSIVAEARHKIEGGTLEVTIEARMKSGETSVEPSGQPVDSPATFTYTAPPERDQSGTVHLRTVSRRGIGEVEVRFDTGGGYRLRLTNEYEGSGQFAFGVSSGSGIDILEGELDAETFDGIFEASSQGSAMQTLGDIAECTQEWVGTQRLRVTGTPSTQDGKPEVLLVFTPAGAPDYSRKEAEGGDVCGGVERESAGGGEILPFNDAFIIDQIPLPVPGPPGEGDPTEYDMPASGALGGTFVLAGWHVEWLEPEP